jgi:hypothetical protein
MSPERLKALRWTALMSGLAVAVCVGILLADYAMARSRAPKDDALIRELQQKVRAEAALAPQLAAEQKRVTEARIGRKRRDLVAGWLLIGVSAIFLAAVRWVLPQRPPYRPPPRKRTRPA